MSEETQIPPKPTKTQDTQNSQTHSRYESIRVPILRASEYPIWKVKTAMFLEATDPEYLDRINDGPYKPTKLSVGVADQPAKMIPKEKSEYTTEDISSIVKDATVKHLLHSVIDNVMSNRVIRCKTTKEIWDVLETRCQGTDVIKKNRKTILITFPTRSCKIDDSDANSPLAMFGVLSRKGELVVSNAGDCCAVICRGGDGVALTSDHGPSREDEKNRILALGGYVECSRTGVWRIGGSLAVLEELEMST
ncbi:hypothetical protein AgCh_021023 [Apium graveolens]